MPRPYNKQTKVDAALLCDVMASNTDLKNLEDAARELDIVNGSTAYRLAAAAYYGCTCFMMYETSAGATRVETFAEAATLIRSGWRIGEFVNARPVQTTLASADVAIGTCWTDENVVAVAEQPNPFLALLDKELSSANAAIDAKEAVIDAYGYGGPTNAELDAIEAEASEDALDHATETVTEDIVDLSTEAV